MSRSKIIVNQPTPTETNATTPRSEKYGFGEFCTMKAKRYFRTVFIGALENIFGRQGEYFFRENVIVDTSNVCQRAMGNNNLFSEIRVQLMVFSIAKSKV